MLSKKCKHEKIFTYNFKSAIGNIRTITKCKLCKKSLITFEKDVSKVKEKSLLDKKNLKEVTE